ncbi:MAG: hypothetical protein ABIB61_04565 [Candidatus Shapirobacteria bacterium]
MTDPKILFENNLPKKKEKKEESLAVKTDSEITPSVENLVEKYKASFHYPLTQSGATVHVDEVASKLAGFYERLRQVIDWKEEHLIRRAAIERILKRRLISELSGIKINSGLEAKQMAEPLVMELVRGGHLPNDEIPKSRILKLEKALSKYIYILENAPWSANQVPANFKKKINFYNWILEIAACEIEDLLDPPLKQMALMNFMAKSLVSRIKVIPEGAMDESEKNIQVMIAVYRTLFHLDTAFISFRLFNYYYPEWPEASAKIVEQVTSNIFSLWEQTEVHLSHPLSGEFFKLAEHWDTLYLILGDVLDDLLKKGEDPVLAFLKKNHLKELIKTAYNQRLSTLKKRLFRAAIYSTLSIFVAGAFSLFIVEVPLARLF